MTTPVKRAPSPLPLEEDLPPKRTPAAKSVEAGIAKRTLRDRREYDELEEGPSAKRAHREPEIVDFTSVAHMSPAMDIIVRLLGVKDTASLMATCRTVYHGVNRELPVNPFDPQGRKLFFETLTNHPLLSKEVLECLHPSISQKEPIAILRHIQQVTSQVFQGTLSPGDAITDLVKQGPDESECMKNIIYRLGMYGSIREGLGFDPSILENGQPNGLLDIVFVLAISQKWITIVTNDQFLTAMSLLKVMFRQLFLQATQDSRKDIIKFFLETPEIRADIKADIITETFRDVGLQLIRRKIFGENDVAERRPEDTIEFLLKTPGVVAKISDGEFAEQLLWAVRNNKANIVKVILETPETKEKINAERLGEAFRAAAWNGYEDSMRVFIENSEMFSKISTDALVKAFSDASTDSCLELSRELIRQSPRFKEIQYRVEPVRAAISAVTSNCSVM